MRNWTSSPGIWLLIVLVSLSTSAPAADRIWDANGANLPDGTFTVANNWNPNAVPGDADTAIFRFGADPTYTVTFPGAPITVPPVSYVNDQLRVGSGEVTLRSNLRATYTLDNPITLPLGRGIIIGELAGDTAVVNSSLLTLSSAAATIGDETGSQGTLNLNAGAFNVTGNNPVDHELIVGRSGNGTLNVAAGARVDVSSTNGSVLVGQGGTINVTAAGASVTVRSSIEVGTGTFNVTNGGQVTVQNGDENFSGTRIVGIGTVNVDGAGSIWRNRHRFSVVSPGLESDNAILNITNGGLVSIDPDSNGELLISGHSALGIVNPGIVNVSGSGSLLTDGAVSVLVGTLNITAGGKVNSTSASVGIDRDTGTATVDGAGSIWTNSFRIDIGFSGLPNTGIVVVKNGGELHGAHARIGGGSVSLTTGTLHVNSGGKVVVSDVIEITPGSPNARGTILVEGEGSILATPELDVGGGGGGLFPGGTADLTINGGSVNVNNLRVYGAGRVNVNGGILDVAGTLTRLAGSVVHLDGGILRVRNAAGLIVFPDTFEWAGGTLNLTETGLTVGAAGPFGSHLVLNSRMGLQVAGALDVNSGAQLVGTGGSLSGATGLNNGTISIIGGSLNYSQPAVNNGNLDALRATLTFPGDGIKNNIGLTNNGTLTLSDVTVNGDVHSPTGSAIKVASGVVFNGLVSGGGQFPGAGTVTFNGGFSPGDSPAIINFAGDLKFGPESTLEMEIGGRTPGTQHDQVNVAGQATLDGALDIVRINGFTPTMGDRFEVMTFGSRVGTFANVTGTTINAGLRFAPVYSPTDLALVVFDPATKTWGVDASGQASVGSNWFGGVPPTAPNDRAMFTSVITANRTVEVDVPLSLSHILFDDDNNYTIAGPQAITISSPFNDPVTIRVRIVHGHGGHTISAPLVLNHDVSFFQESNQPLTIAGPLDNSGGHRIAKFFAGTAVFSGSQTLGSGTLVEVGSGKAQYTLDAADVVSIGTSVVAQISAPATLELAGTKSALSDGIDHANITNAGTLLVTGTSQAVGNITGTGAITVGPAAELTTGVMQQSRLTLLDIGPVVGGKVTLRPNSGTSVLKELVFGIGAPPEPPAAIPEPSTWALAAAALCVLPLLSRRLRRMRVGRQLKA